MNATQVLEQLQGKTIFTVTGKPNRVLAIRAGNVFVATSRSPHGTPVSIAQVQAALDQFEAQGEIKIRVETLGYRSAFIGAVLLSLPGSIKGSGGKIIRPVNEVFSITPLLQPHNPIPTLPVQTPRRQQCTDAEVNHALNALEIQPVRIRAFNWPKDLKGIRVPGLYSWSVDKEGARDLSRGLGLQIKPGRIYVGQAGATRWPSGKCVDATLESRILKMHLGGTECIEYSTLRFTLAAALLGPMRLIVTDPLILHRNSEERLTEWMRSHLDIAILRFPDRDSLKDLEEKVNECLDPPLNINRMPKTLVREQLLKVRAAIKKWNADS